MPGSFRLDRRAFLKGLGGVTLALPVLDAMGAEVTNQIPRRFCAIYTANGMSLPARGARHPRMELVPVEGRAQAGRRKYRFRVRQFNRAADAVPEQAELHGRYVPPQRSEGRPAHLLRYVADRRSAAKPEAGNLQHRGPRSGHRAAHQTVLPAAFAGAFDRCRHRIPFAHRHHLV